MTFSQHLLKLRKERGLKQTELAPFIGISWRAYQTYERGEREPQMSTLIALADFYDVSLDELVCRAEQVERAIGRRLTYISGGASSSKSRYRAPTQSAKP